MKKISVIVPCHNSTRYLQECFVSLTQQTMPMEDLELIFVDDASTDDGATVELLQSYEQLYPQSILVICLSENLRQGGARNVALQYATGKYVLFVDSDDWIAVDACEALYEMAEREGADILQFGHYKFKEVDGRPLLLNSIHYEYEALSLEDHLENRIKVLFRRNCTFGCWGKLFRRDMVMEAGVRFAEHVIYEEPLFVYPLFFFCKKFVFSEQEYYYYRINDAGTMSHDMKEKKKLWDHPHVQQCLLDFMKQTPYYDGMYPWIDLNYLHCMIVDTFTFADDRGFVVDMEEYERLRRQVLDSIDLHLDHSLITRDAFYGGILRTLQGGELTQKQLDVFMRQVRERTLGKQDKISVIIPCYNVEKELSRCLDSIFSQTIGSDHLEIICVDDCSTDRTVEVLKEYEQRYPDHMTVILLEENGKLGNARNVAFGYSHGDYITYVDADDCVAPQMLEEMLAWSKEYDADIVECGYRQFEEEIPEVVSEGEPLHIRMDCCEEKKWYLLNRAWKVGACGRLYKKSFLADHDITFPTGIFMEDIYFSGQCLLHMKNFILLPETYYFYYVNREGITFGKKTADYYLTTPRQQRRTAEMLRAHHWFDDCRREYECLHFSKAFVEPMWSMISGAAPISYDDYCMLKRDLLAFFPEIIDNPYIRSVEQPLFPLCYELLANDFTDEQMRRKIAEWKEKR